MYPLFIAKVRMQRSFLAIVFASALAACSSGPDRPKPAELGPNAALIGVKTAWTVQIGPVNFPLDIRLSSSGLFAASSAGAVVSLDPDSGRELWRTSLGTPLSAGVGADGDDAAVVTQTNEVVLLRSGEVRWRYQLPAQAHTAPLVAGGRVFVLAADRSVTALDGATGRRLWVQQRPGEPLVLKQSGVMLAVGDTLVAGFSGRLTGLNPLNGSLRWEAAVASPRGTNDVERLVDLVGRVSRVDDVVCARAFQSSVGCVDARRGTLMWSKPAQGAQGVHGDGKTLFGTEINGRVVAWKRDSGEKAWSYDGLLHRDLTAPLLIGRSIAVGDGQGWVHLLSREDGAPLNRLATDGSAIVSAPVQAGNTLVVATRNGSVVGFRPE